jgi:diacylglycerol kinase family enzyme
VMPTVLTGKHRKFHEIRTGRTDSITVSSPEGLPVHVDGEILGLEITVICTSIAEKKIQLVC